MPKEMRHFAFANGETIIQVHGVGRSTSLTSTPTTTRERSNEAQGGADITPLQELLARAERQRRAPREQAAYVSVTRQRKWRVVNRAIMALPER
jgi:hypothetical protein